ncbi:addiction module protein [Gemmatimonas sp.]|uniref:addiction module protein n=1 Tax=Gemmatimonas sp. TaxID=1962908 RepID=UPI003F71F334
MRDRETKRHHIRYTTTPWRAVEFRFHIGLLRDFSYSHRYAEWRRTWGSVVFFGEPHQEDSPMVRSSDSLESQLLTLPPADRARLAELLLASLDTDLDAGPATAIEDAWREEATIRLQELRAGTVSGIPAWQVFEAAARRLAP